MPERAIEAATERIEAVDMDVKQALGLLGELRDEQHAMNETQRELSRTQKRDRRMVWLAFAGMALGFVSLVLAGAWAIREDNQEEQARIEQEERMRARERAVERSEKIQECEATNVRRQELRVAFDVALLGTQATPNPHLPDTQVRIDQIRAQVQAQLDKALPIIPDCVAEVDGAN